MEKMTFETARELGLIPYPTKRYFGWFPFMSAYAVEKRDAELEAGYRAEYERIKMDYKKVWFRGEQYEII